MVGHTSGGKPIYASHLNGTGKMAHAGAIAAATNAAKPAVFQAHDPGSEHKEVAAVLERHGYNPRDAKKLVAEGMGPHEVEQRAKIVGGGVGSLEYTHGLARTPDGSADRLAARAHEMSKAAEAAGSGGRLPYQRAHEQAAVAHGQAAVAYRAAKNFDKADEHARISKQHEGSADRMDRIMREDARAGVSGEHSSTGFSGPQVGMQRRLAQQKGRAKLPDPLKR